MIKGLIGGYISKKMVPVKLGFHNVAKDMGVVQDHLSHLHNHTSAWHSYLHHQTQKLEQHLIDLKTELRSDMKGKVSDVIDIMQADVHKLQNQIEKKDEDGSLLQKELADLKVKLQHIFEQYNKHLVQLHKKIAETQLTKQDVVELVNSMISRELESKSNTKHLRVERSQENDVSYYESKKDETTSKVKSLRELAIQLTPAQKSMLTILATTNQKLSYKDMAASYGKSPSTVKTTLHLLKKAGIPILEVSDEGGKRFYLEQNYKKIIMSKNI